MLTRYKDNLHLEGDKVYNFTTHVATIDRIAGKLYRHGHWSQTTSKHINYVASEYGLTIEDRAKNEDHSVDGDGLLKSVAMIAKMGEFFAETQKDKNDWKARMLKAGLQDRGLIMPDDWDELDESEKEKRLNGAIAAIKD